MENIKISDISPEQGEKSPGVKKAIVFVPGLGESSMEIYQDVLKMVRSDLREKGEETEEPRATLGNVRLFAVSTHPEHESEHQNEIYKENGDNFCSEENPPIVCLITDKERERHKSFEHRVELVLQAMQEAKDSGAREITLVGHSAGGLASLAAIAKEALAQQKLPEQEALNIHGVLIAPAIPGEVKKWITTEPGFVKVMLRNIITSIYTREPSYAKQLFQGKDIAPSDEDIKSLLGPMEDKDFERRAVAGAVPISGVEGMDLLQYPRVLGEATQDQWPENISIDVVIPENDQWVSREGQEKLVTEVLRSLADERAQSHSVPGGHMPLGKDEQAMETIIGLINEKQKSEKV